VQCVFIAYSIIILPPELRKGLAKLSPLFQPLSPLFSISAFLSLSLSLPISLSLYPHPPNPRITGIQHQVSMTVITNNITQSLRS
jgi:hypothetical protein